MKKLVLAALAVVIPMTLSAVSPSEEFVDIARKEKNEWLDDVRQMHNDKYLLIIKHNDQIMNSVKKNIAARIRAGGDEASEMAQLKEMFAIHKQQLQDWKSLKSQYRDKAQTIFDRQVKELDTFEKKYLKPPQTDEELLDEESPVFEEVEFVQE